MKNKILFSLFACALSARPAVAEHKPGWEPKEFGVLLLSHGGSAQWNHLVMDVRNSLTSKFPVETAFGMADPIAIQKAIDHLTGRHVKKIVAVPLFVSSHSEVIEQTKYVLGIRKDPSSEFVNVPHAHMGRVVVKRARTQAPIVLAPALDDQPVVAEILLDRARDMSRDPSKESVVLVGHGPLKDSDNELWLGAMDNSARQIERAGKFLSVRSATLRDDSPPPVRQAEDRKLRELVQGLSLHGKVLVVPHLVAQGGIERHVRASLAGTFYEWTGKTLLPDPRIARWVEDSARKAAAEPDMRQFKDEGHVVPGSDRRRLKPLEPTPGNHSH